MSRCKATNKRGELCGAPAMQGSDYCFFHDPEVAEQRAAARAQGGQNRGWAAKRAKELRESTDPDDMLEVSWRRLLELLDRLREGDEASNLSAEIKVTKLLLQVAKQMAARGGLRKPERERPEGIVERLTREREERAGLPDEFGERIARAISGGHTADEGLPKGIAEELSWDNGGADTADPDAGEAEPQQ